MRCHLRQLIYSLLLTISFAILYRMCIPTRQLSECPSQFQIISHENRIYRILSSSFNYDSHGIYLNFAYFNVEQRSRVLKIDNFYDVPISSQWKSSGHAYPTQIAQFGLSHWSRLQSTPRHRSKYIYQLDRLQWTENTDCSSWYTLTNQLPLTNTFISFTISSNTSVHIQFLHNNIELIYSTRTKNNATIPTKVIVPLHDTPRSVNRHMLIDLEKSRQETLAFKSDLIKVRVCGQSKSVVDSLVIGNQTLYNQQAFYSATRWLLNTQDLQTGCWFIHIKRTYGNHHQHHLRMPWCSAMAQGQAASLLVRLYSTTKHHQHLLAVRRAVQPLWSLNITRAYFQDRFLWLEEYPLDSSTQGLFVLNGCLYALIGLIDVSTVDPQSYLSELIDELIHSLREMLPYYVHPHISNWSLYDLSHITMKTKLNSASYSYHLVHITLLQCLSGIFRKTNFSTSEFFDSYARRFLSAIV